MFGILGNDSIARDIHIDQGIRFLEEMEIGIGSGEGEIGNCKAFGEEYGEGFRAYDI